MFSRNIDLCQSVRPSWVKLIWCFLHTPWTPPVFHHLATQLDCFKQPQFIPKTCPIANPAKKKPWWAINQIPISTSAVYKTIVNNTKPCQYQPKFTPIPILILSRWNLTPTKFGSNSARLQPKPHQTVKILRPLNTKPNYANTCPIPPSTKLKTNRVFPPSR